MNATCPNCGKVLKVKDEWAGKTIKCPQCAKTFKAGAAGVTTVAGGVSRTVPNAPKKGAPAAARGATPPKPVRDPAAAQKGGGVAINWGMISLIGGLALIPIGIGIFLAGPRRAMKYWDEHSQAAQDNVTAIVEYAVRAQASHAGTWNPNKSVGGTPSVVDLNFHPDFMVMGTPKTVHFVGTTSNGKFNGDYTFDTTELTGTLTIGGITLGGVHIDSTGVTMPGGQTEKRQAGIPSNIPGATGSANSGNEDHALTGRLVNGNPEVTLDGKKMDIYYPPKTDEDGNPIQ